MHTSILCFFAGSPPPVPTNFSVSVETDNTTVDIASVNAFHLGLNIVFGILALFQTVIAVIFFKKEGTKNNGSRYYAAIVLLAIEGAFLVLVLLLWIVSGTSNGWVSVQ